MVIIVGKDAEKSRCKAEKLFGKIFPEQDFVVAEKRAVINAPSAVVIVEKNAAAEIKSAANNDIAVITASFENSLLIESPHTFI